MCCAYIATEQPLRPTAERHEILPMALSNPLRPICVMAMHATFPGGDGLFLLGQFLSDSVIRAQLATRYFIPKGKG